MTNKILLIDDSITQLEVMKLNLIKNGFDVETAENATAGFQKIFTFVPDVILADVLMPEIDGYQLCTLIKNNILTKNIPVLLLTVLDKKADKFWGKKAGAEAFMTKTADFKEIKEQITTLIQNSEFSEEDKNLLKNSNTKNQPVEEQLNQILEEQLRKATFLNEFRVLNEFCSFEKVLVEKCFDLFSTFFEYDAAGLFFNVNKTGVKKILYLDTKNSTADSQMIEKLKKDFFAQMQGINSAKNVFAHETIRENINSEEKMTSPDIFSTAFIVPFVSENNLLGGVVFYSKEQIDYEQSPFYLMFKNELQALMKVKFLYSEIEILSVTDGLTSLYNRRLFEYNIEREFLRAKRYKNNLSLAILDIDLFKKVNDTYGHLYGDYVLKEVAKLMTKSFRKVDTIYRYGGEEFAVILPETPLEKAAIPAERLRKKIEQHEFVYNNIKSKITVSIGISTMNNLYENRKEIIDTADKALYHGKQTGRNKVVIYDKQFDINK